MIPPWLIALLLRYVLPIVITWLQKEGFLNAGEALAAKGATAVFNEVKDLKTYPVYSTGKNGQTDEPPHAEGPPNGNFNQG